MSVLSEIVLGYLGTLKRDGNLFRDGNGNIYELDKNGTLKTKEKETRTL